MLDKLFAASLMVVLAGLIAGVSYERGRTMGELETLRSQRAQAATPDREPATTDVPLISRPSNLDIERKNAAILERLQAQQDARRAARAGLQDQRKQRKRRAERTAATLAGLQRQQQALEELQQRTAEIGRELDRGRPDPRGRSTGGWDAVGSKGVAYSQTTYVSLCPPGLMLIAATCLPANSIILGQAPIVVQMVKPFRPTETDRNSRKRERARPAPEHMRPPEPPQPSATPSTPPGMAVRPFLRAISLPPVLSGHVHRPTR